MICNAYGSDNDGYLPLGNIWGDQGKEEGWLDVNYEMVNNLYKRYGATEEIGLCKSWQFEKEKYFYEPPYVDDFNFRVGGTRLGYIYYGGRFDQAGSAYSPLKKDGSVYKSPRRVMDSGKKSIGSSTLLSCFHWDSINAGGNWGAKIPHAGSGGRGIYMQPDSKKVTPEPRGLVIGYMDNSSEWVKWDRLDWFEQGGKIRIYFSER
ncbi:MAG: hypothetical protein NTW55_01995 [Planctomycetota bacterium]|nr:hypothetical protein [Planctomycetota bacterium]